MGHIILSSAGTWGCLSAHVHCAAGDVKTTLTRAAQPPHSVNLAAGHMHFTATGARGAMDMGQVDVAGSLVGPQAASH